MKKFITTIICSLLICAFVPLAQAKVSVSVKNKYFNISGKTGKQVYRQIKRRRPANMRRTNAIARTRANFNFKDIRFGRKGKKCVATRVNLKISITYSYPKWNKRKGSSKNLRRRWNAFEKEIHRHEKVHGKLYTDFVRKVEKIIRGTSSTYRRGCRQAINSAKRKILSLRRKVDAKNVKFDRNEQRRSSKIKRLEVAFYKAK